MKIILCSLFLLSQGVSADNLSSLYLSLWCQDRGSVEVIFHRYQHTDERWDGGFEIGAGHRKKNNVEFTEFQNGDTLMHSLKNDTYYFRYFDNHLLKRCLVYKRSPVTVVSTPYVRE